VVIFGNPFSFIRTRYYFRMKNKLMFLSFGKNSHVISKSVLSMLVKRIVFLYFLPQSVQTKLFKSAILPIVRYDPGIIFVILKN
jgi:hypothetical protein